MPARSIEEFRQRLSRRFDEVNQEFAEVAAPWSLPPLPPRRGAPALPAFSYRREGEKEGQRLKEEILELKESLQASRHEYDMLQEAKNAYLKAEEHASQLADSLKAREKELKEVQEALARAEERLAKISDGRSQGEEELGRLKETLARAEERVKELTAALEEGKAKSRMAEQEMASLRDSVAQRSQEVAQSAGRIRALEQALVERDSELAQRQSRLERVSEELKRIQSLAGTEAPAFLPVAEPPGPVSTANPEVLQKLAELEEKLSDRELALRESLQENHRLEADLQQSLRARESEYKLMKESMNRLGRQNKELLAKLKEYQESRLQVNRPTTSPSLQEADARVKEKLDALELALSGRDRMLADQQKALEEKKALVDSLFTDMRALDEQALGELEGTQRKLEEMARQKEALAAENESLKKALEEKNRAEDPQLSELKERLSLASRTAQEKMTEKETQWLAQAQQKEMIIDELKRQLTASEARMAEGKAAGEPAEGKAGGPVLPGGELDIHLGLLQMNGELIDRLEGNLRHFFRVMPASQSPSPLARPVPSDPVRLPSEGTGNGMTRFFKGFFSRFGKKKSAPAKASARPPVPPSGRPAFPFRHRFPGDARRPPRRP
ncbi:MAG: hypothetical protein HY548_08785 [Elusimicrobia bacterium]|nr:hypothetical protein [Elusimicrobiota bacterium]